MSAPVCPDCQRVACTCPPWRLLALFVLCLVALVGCPVPSPAPTHPDAAQDGAAPIVDGGDEYDRACATIALYCAQPAARFCAESMRASPRELGIEFNVACLAAATSKAGVRACGQVECL